MTTATAAHHTHTSPGTPSAPRTHTSPGTPSAPRTPPRTVLVLNSGSSSLKYQLVDPDSGVALAKGLVERIGEQPSIPPEAASPVVAKQPTANATATPTSQTDQVTQPVGRIHHQVGEAITTVAADIPDHGVALQRVLALFSKVGPDLAAAGLAAVGHRVVQGGNHFSGPVLVDDDVVSQIAELCPLAPLHNPANLRGIELAREVFEVPQVAVFDTAFFHDLPAAAATYALDTEVAQRLTIRRYGAHGTSHQYVSQQVSTFLGRSNLRQIVLHLGNGASASAVVGGQAVETSMGLTPLEGLVMGTRTGDIDPAVVFHLARVGEFSLAEVDTLLNKRSGMLGLTGANDMREIWARADQGEAAARAGLDVYLHRLVKYVGAYAAVMGGLDVLTFTAGIGENDARLRAELCSRLRFLGIALDSHRNEAAADPGTWARDISAAQAPVRVLVVPTNEELAIARQTAGLLPS